MVTSCRSARSGAPPAGTSRCCWRPAARSSAASSRRRPSPTCRRSRVRRPRPAGWARRPSTTGRRRPSARTVWRSSADQLHRARPRPVRGRGRRHARAVQAGDVVRRGPAPAQSQLLRRHPARRVASRQRAVRAHAFVSAAGLRRFHEREQALVAPLTIGGVAAPAGVGLRVLRARGLRARFSCASHCTVTARLVLPAAAARRLPCRARHRARLRQALRARHKRARGAPERRGAPQDRPCHGAPRQRRAVRWRAPPPVGGRGAPPTVGASCAQDSKREVTPCRCTEK